MNCFLIIRFVSFCLLFAVVGKAQTPPPEPLNQFSHTIRIVKDSTFVINRRLIKAISPGVLDIGGVRIYAEKGMVEFPAAVNMDKGLLEYLIVGKTGKTHESLLRTRIEPYHLQIALLMIGLKGTNNPLAEQGDPRKPEGDPVQVWIRWEHGGRTVKLRIERWVYNKNKNGPMQLTDWIFTGSFVYKRRFMAQMEQSIMAVFHDPAAMIDNPLPDGDSDEVWFVNEKKVPPEGTIVRVLIKKKRK